MRSVRLFLWIALAAGGSPALAQPSFAQGDCGSLANPVGPYDYRQHVKLQTPILRNVEGNHFAPQVENLIKGQTSYLGGDIEYVLRAFPNHPRALASLARLSARQKSEKILGLQYPVSCYFARAIHFTPNDATVHAIYAVHLSKFGNGKAALTHIEEALRLGANDPNTYYNAGLLYFEAKQYDKSLEYAKKAYAGGFPLSGLRKQLQSVGKWTD
jgi:tetratricopeptide (TPR) repeat protein